ncbi:MAG: energy-coupling factor transporter transmembrane protein EcfT [Eubacteriales bacterium]
MLKDITLGQFFPGSSPLHRCDPRMKIILSFIYIAAIFMAKNVYAFLFLALSVAALVAVSGIKPVTVLRGLKPLLFVIIFTAVINIFWTSGETLLVELGPIKIYAQGIYYALFMILRISSLVAATSMLLTYTTSPIQLTDALERLLGPLKKIKAPVHEFAMMMTIALRFIPTLIDETDKIINAQKARGADFESGSLIRRAKALVPVLVPLIISAFRRAEELAVAMECRCYRGGEGRTKLRQLKYTGVDAVMLLVSLACLAIIVWLNYIPSVVHI